MRSGGALVIQDGSARDHRQWGDYTRVPKPADPRRAVFFWMPGDRNDCRACGAGPQVSEIPWAHELLMGRGQVGLEEPAPRDIRPRRRISTGGSNEPSRERTEPRSTTASGEGRSVSNIDFPFPAFLSRHQQSFKFGQQVISPGERTGD